MCHRITISSFIERFYLQISPLLTLRSINENREEMSYIIRMRNAIDFQMGGSKDYEHLKRTFSHRFILDKDKVGVLDSLLDHALYAVEQHRFSVKSIAPFFYWKVITTNNEYIIQKTNVFNLMEEIRSRNGEQILIQNYLLATFGKTFLRISSDPVRNEWDDMQLNTDTLSKFRLKKPMHERDLNSHEFTWRRVYEQNNTCFLCEDADITAYLYELERKKNTINVFKQVIKREIYEPFNQFEILKTIASPYYYVLPHQDEEEYSQDNAAPHSSRIAEEWPQKYSSEFRHFSWPTKSPVMNSIEHIWDALQRAVQKRYPPHLTLTDLQTSLQDSWCPLPPALLQTLIESMTRRVAALFRARGCPTRY
ncbi:transposable element tcb2 transposase [Trichonephila clavipes]|nr:transposable element tcb2 transposase [Trichonephila clavipes]